MRGEGRSFVQRAAWLCSCTTHADDPSFSPDPSCFLHGPDIHVRCAPTAAGAMVVKTDICAFSGLRIYPGHGKFYIRSDMKGFKFISRKVRNAFHQRANPRKIAWTQLYRRMHKKGTLEESSKKKSRRVNKSAMKAVAGASLEVLKAKRNQKPEVRAAAREAALREVKERAKAKQAVKKAEKPKAAPTKAPVQKSKASNKSSNKQGAKGVRR